MRDTFWKLHRRQGSPFWQAGRQYGGKKLRSTVGTENKGEALSVITRWNRELADPVTAAATTVTLGAIWTAFLDQQKMNAPAGTVSYYEKKAKALVGFLGKDLRLADITVQTRDCYVEYRRTERRCREHEDGGKRACRNCRVAVSKTTLKKELRLLRQLLELAAERGVYAGRPERVVPNIKAKYQPRETWLTIKQAEGLWRELRRRNPARAAHFGWIVGSGARLGEASRARAEHVNGTKLYIPGTKTDKAASTIPITELMAPWLERALRDAKPNAAAEGLLFGAWPNMRRDLHAACKIVSVPLVTANDLRRSMITWHFHAGAPMEVLAQLARHTSTKMVELVYARRTPSAMASLVARYVPLAEVDRKHLNAPRNRSARSASRSVTRKSARSRRGTRRAHSTPPSAPNGPRRPQR